LSYPDVRPDNIQHSIGSVEGNPQGECSAGGKSHRRIQTLRHKSHTAVGFAGSRITFADRGLFSRGTGAVFYPQLPIDEAGSGIRPAPFKSRSGWGGLAG